MQRKIILNITEDLVIPSELQMPGSRVALMVDGATVEVFQALFRPNDPRQRPSQKQSYQSLELSVASVTVEPASEPVVEEATQEPSATGVESEPQMTEPLSPTLD